MKKKLDKNEKLLQLSEEEMKAISEDQNKQEAEKSSHYKINT